MPATTKFKEISPFELNENPFKIIGKDWFLITAGVKEDYNTMTGGWGMMGVLWQKAVVCIYIRPTRHTWNFTEKYQEFTLCFFEEKYREILNYCGSVSGKNQDKVKECGLTLMESKSGNLYFEEARLVMECRKIYVSDLDPGLFLESSIEHHYPLKDYHRMYVGEIFSVLTESE